LRQEAQLVKKATVHLFVFNSVSDWEYGYLADGINDPQFQKTPGKFKVKTVALSDKPITTVGGLRVTPDTTLDKLKPTNSTMLVLPGGSAWDKKRNKEAVEAAAKFLDKGVPVAAIGGATAGLARAGLLDEVAHTSNSKEYLTATGYQGDSFYQDKPAVIAGKLITASTTNPVNFAAAIFLVLDLYPEAVLSAWYNLYKTGDKKYYTDLLKAAS
jgi:putative intracellular protease/amidase